MEYDLAKPHRQAGSINAQMTFSRHKIKRVAYEVLNVQLNHWVKKTKALFRVLKYGTRMRTLSRQFDVVQILEC